MDTLIFLVSAAVVVTFGYAVFWTRPGGAPRWLAPVCRGAAGARVGDVGG